ncbi:hypothetical protein CPT_Stills10 [Bacillus phage Stills]|uniref:Uncharacterized protein n=1 Tax=Bacillus phage Stills TaxID=1610833 RepID=A0A0E3X9H6_9CAUD|nr:hypothetical protein CPT_Stills10 [Bacillus phage Stills]AKC02638.1 hypothetical protein CPT_Stills10 [Bacillus phage Stills]
MNKPDQERNLDICTEINGQIVYINDVFKHRDVDSFIQITGISHDDEIVNDTEIYYLTHDGESDWMVLAYLMEHYEKVERL